MLITRWWRVSTGFARQTRGKRADRVRASTVSTVSTDKSCPLEPPSGEPVLRNDIIHAICVGVRPFYMAIEGRMEQWVTHALASEGLT